MKALEIPVTFENPYRFATKGEMLAQCRDAPLAQRHIVDTISCSSTAKARWQRLRHELETAAVEAGIVATSFPDCASALLGGDSRLRSILAHRLGHPVAVRAHPPGWEQA